MQTPGANSLSQWYSDGINITMNDILPWATPMDWEKISQWLDGAKPEAEPTEERFLVIATSRLSLQGAEDGSDVQRFLNAIPRTAHRYDIALNGGHLLPHEEGQRPTAVMRQFLMAFVRKGIHAIPTALDNRIADLFLIAFVQLMRQVTRVNSPNPPREIHHLVLGIAGFSADIDNWGSRHKGYFKFLLDADSRNGINHFEENTYLIPVIEDHVINGCPTSIDSPHRSLQWRGYSGKYTAKFKLRSLIDRNHVRNVNVSGPPEALRPYRGLDIMMRIGTTMLATTTFWERCKKSGAGEPSNTMGWLSRQTP
jgi:hypothetical protein